MATYLRKLETLRNLHETFKHILEDRPFVWDDGANQMRASNDDWTRLRQYIVIEASINGKLFRLFSKWTCMPRMTNEDGYDSHEDSEGTSAQSDHELDVVFLGSDYGHDET
ncbi:UNVERIFIED_CONTAM: hypothetical protein Sradi_5097400 [Sesamum radiatum]|uniref:Myb/SANT-like domain-containing protein n=1 Tax=Sesamum radiatum TaxID=300843 RepID=A0AAW2M468_SESRA